MSQPKIVVLASGEGTTAEALNQKLPIYLVICNRPKAGIFARMSKLNIPCKLASTDEELSKLIYKTKPDLIVLLGYLRKVPPQIVRAYAGRMLNTHNGLLPETKGQYGLKTQEYVLASKLPEAGQTLHLVTENYDEGPVVAEHKIAVNPDDTPQSLLARVQVVEKQYIASDIINFMKQASIWPKSL